MRSRTNQNTILDYRNKVYFTVKTDLMWQSEEYRSALFETQIFG